MFDSYLADKAEIVKGYILYYVSLNLIEINKFRSCRSLMTESLNFFDEKNYNIMTSCRYNLGIINISINNYEEGVHHLEEANRIVTNNNLLTKTLLKIRDTLSLVYLSRKHMMAAFCMINQTIRIRNLSSDNHQLVKATKYKFYISFIIDQLEQYFIFIKRKFICNIKLYYIGDNQSIIADNDENNLEVQSSLLINYAMTGLLNIDQKFYMSFNEGINTIKVIESLNLFEFIKTLSHKELKNLNNDNPINYEKCIKEFSGRSCEMRLLALQKPESLIEIKKSFYNELSPEKKRILKSLNLTHFRRPIILRDELGPIDHFNLNYHPIYSHSFIKIIQNIISNSFFQEISNFHNVLNYHKINSSSILDNLAKYLSLKDMNLAVVNEKYKFTNRIEKIIEQKMKIKHNNSDKFQTIYSLDSEKTIQYSVFFENVLIKLKMQDQYGMLNDLLMKTYVHLEDEEILYIMDKPEKLLNFIVNDTALFKKDHEEDGLKEFFNKFLEEKENIHYQSK